MASAAEGVGVIAARILVPRGQRVMLDADLAALYGVTTSRLNEQVLQDKARVPADFMFRLSRPLSQIATTSRRSRRRDRAPHAFTEHGCLMVANVLRSGRAVNVRRLTRFPELPKRGTGFTAPRPEEK